MSHISATPTTEKEPITFECLPPEIVVKIYSALPDLRSILHLCLTSREFHTILLENESAIARGFATRLLGYDNRSVLKLAFLTCESHILDGTSEDSDSSSEHDDSIPRDGDNLGFENLPENSDNSSAHSDCSAESHDNSAGDRVSKFIDKYVNRKVGPSKLYRLRALRLMPKINMAVERVLDWLGLYGTIWPLKLDDKFFTHTETMRLRRMVYAFEIYVSLFDPIATMLTDKELQRLARKFWFNFSGYESNTIFSILCIIGPFTTWSCQSWREATGHTRHEHCPWEIWEELRNILNAVGLAWRSGMRPTWTSDSRVYHAYKKALMMPSKPGQVRQELYGLRHFATDPTWYIATEGVNEWMNEGSYQWRIREHYFDPRAYRFSFMQGWFFQIGDEDRCRAVRDYGPVWSWYDDPPERSSNDITEPTTDGSEHVRIVWNEDPTQFGFEGSAGTVVDAYDLRLASEEDV